MFWPKIGKIRFWCKINRNRLEKRFWKNLRVTTIEICFWCTRNWFLCTQNSFQNIQNSILCIQFVSVYSKLVSVYLKALFHKRYVTNTVPLFWTWSWSISTLRIVQNSANVSMCFMWITNGRIVSYSIEHIDSIKSLQTQNPDFNGQGKTPLVRNNHYTYLKLADDLEKNW